MLAPPLKTTLTSDQDISQLNCSNWVNFWAKWKNKAYNNSVSWGTILPYSLWVIWLQRNHNTFNNEKQPISLDRVLALACEQEHLLNYSPTLNSPVSNIYVSWNKPSSNTYALNVDGSTGNKCSQSGTGCVIRDSQGDWIVGAIDNTLHCSSLMAELIALKRGLQLAAARNAHPLIIQTDSSSIISILNSNNAMFSNIILECRCLMDKLQNPVLSHIFREQNRVADTLAKQGRQGPKGRTLFERPPLSVNKLLLDDKNGRRFCRQTNNILFSLGDQDVAPFSNYVDAMSFASSHGADALNTTA